MLPFLPSLPSPLSCVQPSATWDQQPRTLSLGSKDPTKQLWQHMLPLHTLLQITAFPPNNLGRRCFEELAYTEGGSLPWEQKGMILKPIICPIYLPFRVYNAQQTWCTHAHPTQRKLGFRKINESSETHPSGGRGSAWSQKGGPALP